MTCFWDGILRKLSRNEHKLLGDFKPVDKRAFIQLLKAKAKPMRNVWWQGAKLEEKFMKEAVDDIKSYKINLINHGHLTSTCDPFLLLICELCQVTIIHSYLNHKIEYKNIKNSTRTIQFSSNRGHFQ